MEGVSVYNSIFSTTVNLIDFALGCCIAEDPRKCGVECEVVWVSGSQKSCKQQYQKPRSQFFSNGYVSKGHMTSLFNNKTMPNDSTH